MAPRPGRQRRSGAAPLAEHMEGALRVCVCLRVKGGHEAGRDVQCWGGWRAEGLGTRQQVPACLSRRSGTDAAFTAARSAGHGCTHGQGARQGPCGTGDLTCGRVARACMPLSHAPVPHPYCRVGHRGLAGAAGALRYTVRCHGAPSSWLLGTGSSPSQRTSARLCRGDGFAIAHALRLPALKCCPHPLPAPQALMWDSVLHAPAPGAHDPGMHMLVSGKRPGLPTQRTTANCQLSTAWRGTWEAAVEG